MKKKLFVSVLVGLLFVSLVGCGKKETKKEAEEKVEPLQAEVIVEGTGSDEESWVFLIGDESIIEYASMESEPIDKTENGRINEHYFFKGLKEGKTTITLNHILVAENGEGEVFESIEYEAVVDKDLNVTLK